MKENTRILILVFVVAFVTLLVGCYPSHEPIITSDPVKTADVGVAYTYNVNATDPDGDTLTYSLTTKPDGMDINSATGLIKWTPTAEGNYAVVVKVSDGVFDITQSFTITVIWDPQILEIVVVPDTITLSLGATLQLRVTALYDDGNHGDITSDCIYVSSNTKVVPLFDDGNLIAGQSPGEATITVTYILDEIIFRDTVEVTVEADIVEEVVI